MEWIEGQWWKAVPPLFLSVVALTTSQDYLQAVLLDRGFYIHESLLFKLQWLLFIPVISLWKKAVKPELQQPRPVHIVLSMALLLSLLHLSLAGALMAFIAQHALALPFTFAGIGKYLFSHELFSTLFVYTLLAGWPHYVQWFKKEKPDAPFYPDTLTVRQGKKLIPLPVREIGCIRSAAPYVDISAQGKHYLHQSSLKQLSDLLNPASFVRIHRSTIVNIDHIRELRSRSNGDYDVLMQDGTTLRWSRHYHQDLKKALHLGVSKK